VPPRDGPSDAIADQLAIDLSKSPLRFGQAATFESVSSFVHGINGLVVDLKGAPADGAQIDAGDFMFMVGNDNMPDTWQPGPAPDRIVVLPNAGVDGSDRTLIECPNGAIVDTWLRITVKANADTGLAADEDFFYGNVRGDTGAAFVGVGEFFGRGARDFQSVALELFHRVGVGNPNDVDGNGIVDAFDLQAIATASGGGVNLRVIEAITPQPAALDAAAVRAVAAPPMPSPLVETDRAAPLPRAARDTAKDAAFGQMGISQNGGISFETRRTSAETPDSLAHLRAELGSDLPLATAIRTDPRDLALQLFAPI
jgi:hypothetical protein